MHLSAVMQWVKPSATTSAFRVVPVQVPTAPLLIQPSADALRKAVENGPSPLAPVPMWETSVELQAAGFSLAQSWPLLAIWRVTLFLSLPPPAYPCGYRHSLCLSGFALRINKNKSNISFLKYKAGESGMVGSWQKPAVQGALRRCNLQCQFPETPSLNTCFPILSFSMAPIQPSKLYVLLSSWCSLSFPT